jgi:hypothetical protein
LGTIPLPLTSNKVYCVYYQQIPEIGGDVVRGKLYDGSNWGNEEVCSTSNVDGHGFQKFTAVAIGDNVYVAFTKQGSYDAIFNVRTYGVGWGNESTIFSGITHYNTPCLSVNGTGLVCFWLNATSKLVLYKNWTSGSGWDANATTLVDESAGGFSEADVISTEYSASNSAIGVMWVNNWNGSAYPIRYATLAVSTPTATATATPTPTPTPTH